MKSKLQFLFVFIASIACLQAQEIAVNTSMGADYENQIYYKLNTQTATAFARDSWDIALLRVSTYDFGIRVNDGIGIDVFEASNTPSDWSKIDIENEASWTILRNSETTWSGGAFDQGSATYGFGEYNSTTHNVDGTIIFVLKYADGTYRKFINEEFAAGYTFKYATWDASTSAWSTDQTVTVPNTKNPNNKFNYYSLQDNLEVVAELAIADWDFVFTKYIIDYYGDGTVFYPVTGVLHSDEVTVAENDEPSGMPANSTLTYSDEINTIGRDWKSFNGLGYTVNSNQAYYVKYADDTIYRLTFTAFSGSSSGDLTFVFENVTASLNIKDVSKNVSFGLYPNPSTDKKINLVYDVSTLSNDNNNVAIYSTTGQKVFQTILSSNQGFRNKSLNLSSLSSGIYMLKFTSGEFTTNKKIILK